MPNAATLIEVLGKPIGRVVNHDPRSLDYQVQPDGAPTLSIQWARIIAILDQGQVGSCTGNATVGNLGTEPFYDTLAEMRAAGLTLDEAEALKIYSAAEVIDGDGPYPPNDNGSSGLSVAKAAKNAGLISGYLHMTSLAACMTAIKTGPFCVGSNWWTGMDTPDANGLVTATGTIRGGHEYECNQYDAVNDLWWMDNSWGTSYGVQGRFCMSSATLTALLADSGDATQFVPLTQPAPTPIPVPTPTPTPNPTPVPVPDLAAAVAEAYAVAGKWVNGPHVGTTKKAAQALKAVFVAAGLMGAHEA